MTSRLQQNHSGTNLCRKNTHTMDDDTTMIVTYRAIGLDGIGRNEEVREYFRILRS